MKHVSKERRMHNSNKTKEKMNVVYYICHDIGRELGCYSKPLSTPNLDQFANDGVCFTNAYCSSAACSPSRGCAMTGKYAHVNGQVGLAHMGWPLPEEQKTVVDYLNDAGYETVHFGLSHERSHRANHYQIDTERNIPGVDDYNAKIAIDQAVDYLDKKKNAGKPFYLNIGTNDTHISRWLWGWESRDFGGETPLEKTYIPPYIADTVQNRRCLSKFQQAIKYMDNEMARLFLALGRHGYSENTLVVFTTDHGITNLRSKGTLYSRGMEISLLAKGPGVSGGRRLGELIQNIDVAPTILEACGVPVPCDMQGRSFLPLLTGSPYTPHQEIFLERNFHGEPLVEQSRSVDIYKKYISSEGKPPPFSDVYDPIRGIRTENYSYIRYFAPDLKLKPVIPAEVLGLADADCNLINNEIIPKDVERPEEELFDIKNDPLELINLAGRPEFSEIKKDLKHRLEHWMTTTDDPVITGRVPVKTK